MRGRRRPRDPVRRRAIASVGPVEGAIGQVHLALTAALGRSAAGMPVEVAWPLLENDIPTMRYHWWAGVYHLGGDVDDGQPVYRAAWGLPGLLVLHSFVLDEIVRSLGAVDQPVSWATQREIVEARIDLGRDPATAFIPSVSPSVAAIVRRARGIVVFAEAARAYLEALGCRTPVHVIAPPVVDTPADVVTAGERAPGIRASLPGCGRLVVAPTDRAEAEDIEGVLAAVGAMPADVHVALVGMADPGRDTLGLGAGSGLGDRLHVQHDLPLPELLAWLAAADVIVDLRRPHHVDVALGALRSMQAGAAIITTADATVPGAPADAVITVGAERHGDEIATAVGSLLESEGERARLGAAARAFADAERRRGPLGYAAAVEDAVRVALDPIRPSMDRWASAVADLGGDERSLEAGYFLRYAEALTSFSGSPQEPDRGAGDPLLHSG
jgi:hypothetical protein